ncbi:MAG: ABC transporter ATP-binding protein [Planctomycetota bacterium]|nr:MAG: ABC transporter ATP-binding protein [Planctomycetota bacterium]
MSAPVIRCVGLARWYGEVQGLSGLTVDVSPGVVGLLGPNGSGKTTLMRLLTGLARPTRGHAELFGTRVSPDQWAVFRRVGYAPGDDVHFESERGSDFLALMARVAGDGPMAARARARAALEKVGMEELATKKLSTMSKGMRQRIKVAQALLLEPELLLLDEPLNGMDPVSRRKTINLVRAHGAAGGTVLFSSHILHEVESVTDRMLLLHHGRLLAEGRLSEIVGLLERKPRRVQISSGSRREIAAALLQEDYVSGVSFGDDSQLLLETRDLNRLLDRLQAYGGAGQIESMEIADENLESVFDTLVGSAV